MAKSKQVQYKVLEPYDKIKIVERTYEYETDFDAGRKQERMPREVRNQLKGYTFVGTASSDFKIDNGHIWFAREVYIKGMKVKDKPKKDPEAKGKCKRHFLIKKD